MHQTALFSMHACTDHLILPIIDDTLRSCPINITNVSINEEQWLQVSLSIRAGGLGVRKVSTIASSAFLSSVYTTSFSMQRRKILRSGIKSYFIPIVIETMGPIGSKASSFFSGAW